MLGGLGAVGVASAGAGLGTTAFFRKIDHALGFFVDVPLDRHGYRSV